MLDKSLLYLVEDDTSTSASSHDGDNGERGAEFGRIGQESSGIFNRPGDDTKPLAHPLVGATWKTLPLMHDVCGSVYLQTTHNDHEEWVP